MATTVAEKRAKFRSLHQEGCFVLPNPWDAGSARMLQHLGFAALASTSTGYAWTTGRPDYAVTREDVLGHLASLSASVDIPVNADFESGFAAEPEGVAASVVLAIETGVAGLSIEDRKLDGTNDLFDLSYAVERIRAAREAIDRSGEDVILVARTEGLLSDPAAISPAIDKLVAFAEAGADCLYAPGASRKGRHRDDGTGRRSQAAQCSGHGTRNERRRARRPRRAADQCRRRPGTGRLGRLDCGCRTNQGGLLRGPCRRNAR